MTVKSSRPLCDGLEKEKILPRVNNCVVGGLESNMVRGWRYTMVYRPQHRPM